MLTTALLLFYEKGWKGCQPRSPKEEEEEEREKGNKGEWDRPVGTGGRRRKRRTQEIGQREEEEEEEEKGGSEAKFNDLLAEGKGELGRAKGAREYTVCYDWTGASNDRRRGDMKI